MAIIRSITSHSKNHIIFRSKYPNITLCIKTDHQKIEQNIFLFSLTIINQMNRKIVIRKIMKITTPITHPLMHDPAIESCLVQRRNEIA